MTVILTVLERNLTKSQRESSGVTWDRFIGKKANEERIIKSSWPVI